MKPKQKIALTIVALFFIGGFIIIRRPMNEPSKPTLFSPGIGKRGMTQLHYDAYCGNLEGLVWCLENGFKVNTTDNYRGYTPTHWLADMAAVDGPRVEMLRALVAHGADLNLKSANGQTALMLARDSGSNGGDELAAELLKLGAKPE